MTKTLFTLRYHWKTVVGWTLTALLGASVALAQVTLEVPRADQTLTGVGLISGWACQADTITVQFDDHDPVRVLYGGERGDTVAVCGHANTGFVLLVNWNNLGAGMHTVTLTVNDTVVVNRSVKVVTYGQAFMAGREKRFFLRRWPTPDADTVIGWNESLQNFEIVDIYRDEEEWHGFDITVTFGEGFNDAWRVAVENAVGRWEEVIVADYPNVVADQYRYCGREEWKEVDDLWIQVEWQDRPGHIGGAAVVCDSVPTLGFPGGRPTAGIVYLNSYAFNTEKVIDADWTEDVLLHEIGHVLGIGGFWERTGYLRLGVDRPEWTGPKAAAAYARVRPVQAASARSRGVYGVPVEDDGIHWRDQPYAVDGDDFTYYVGDLMGPGVGPLTEISIGALEDIGYAVDYDAADPE